MNNQCAKSNNLETDDKELGMLILFLWESTKDAYGNAQGAVTRKLAERLLPYLSLKFFREIK